MRYFVLERKEQEMSKKTISVGLTPDVVKIIDSVRGDVARSLYLRKLITEVVYKELSNDLTLHSKSATPLLQKGFPA